MSQISISAKIYADSLIKSGLENDIVISNLNLLKEIIASSTDLEKTILNPTISAKIKMDILNEIFKDKLNDKIKNFIKILIEKDRFSELDVIIEAYLEEVDKINNVQKIQIISAVSLNDIQKKQIIDKLTQKLSKSVIPDWQTDESIIGGLVIKYDNQVIDSSINTKLNMISKR